MSENKNESNIIQYFLAIAPYLNQFTIDDIAIMISDTEKIIWDVKPTTYKWPKATYVGENLDPDWVIYKAIHKGERIVEEVGKKVLGISMPIYENNSIVGGICLYQSIQRRNKLLEIANSLYKTVNNLDHNMQQIAAEAEELSATSNELDRISNEANNQVGDTDDVIEVIRKIAGQTNLIGLNAAIEAARVGEHGRGFAVVADEVRKLANTSSVSTKNIKQTLDKVKSAVQEINASLKEMTTVTNHQAISLANISSDIDKLTSLADSIVHMSKDLTNDLAIKKAD